MSWAEYIPYSMEGHWGRCHDEWTEYMHLVLIYLYVLTSLSGEVCAHYKDGVCPDGDDCPYSHPREGSIGLVHASLTCSVTLVRNR